MHTLLRRKGLWPLCTDMSREGMDRAAQLWLAGECRTVRDINPLVIATCEIVQKCRELGIVLDGSCPLCAVDRALCNASAGDSWADNCTDNVYLFCIVNRFVRGPTLQ